MEKELLDLSEPRLAHSLLDQPLVISVATCTDDLNDHPQNIELSGRFLDDLNNLTEMNATNNLKPIQTVKGNFYKKPDLSKFRYKFNGKTCVREFLTNFEEYCVARDIADNHILNSFAEVLTDSALKWFRSVRTNIFTWQRLKFELLRRFDKLNFDYQLEFDLRTRKQRQGETLSDFIIDLVDMSNRLTIPLQELTLLEILRHNMLPKYSMHLLGRNIISINELVQFSKIIEEYNSTQTEERKPQIDARKFNKKPYVAVVTSPPSAKNCLKCDESGHSFKECRKIPGMICFRCKKANTTVKFCTNCNPVVDNEQPGISNSKN
ncbi:uncharacterized protein [Choristoneura fumiferana]|uniref:uncharacterized protein n=1 Tax=Choristoneura fumiferana TaxID=7141 RepID=UPI003D153BCB